MVAHLLDGCGGVGCCKTDRAGDRLGLFAGARDNFQSVPDLDGGDNGRLLHHIPEGDNSILTELQPTLATWWSVYM